MLLAEVKSHREVRWCLSTTNSSSENAKLQISSLCLVPARPRSLAKKVQVFWSGPRGSRNCEGLSVPDVEGSLSRLQTYTNLTPQICTMSCRFVGHPGSLGHKDNISESRSSPALGWAKPFQARRGCYINASSILKQLTEAKLNLQTQAASHVSYKSGSKNQRLHQAASRTQGSLTLRCTAFGAWDVEGDSWNF